MGNDARNPPHFSGESGGSVTTTYVLLTLDGAHSSGALEGSELPSRRVHAGLMVIPLTSVVTETSFTVKVTRDSAGDVAVTEEIDQAAVFGEDNSDSGTVVLSFNVPWITDGVAFYVWIKATTAGTATVGEATLTWTR